MKHQKKKKKNRGNNIDHICGDDSDGSDPNDDEAAIPIVMLAEGDGGIQGDSDGGSQGDGDGGDDDCDDGDEDDCDDGDDGDDDDDDGTMSTITNPRTLRINCGYSGVKLVRSSKYGTPNMRWYCFTRKSRNDERNEDR